MANSKDDLQTAVDNVHAALIKCTKQVIVLLATSQQHQSAAADWIEYANQLQRLAPDYASPSWLTEAVSIFGLKFNGTSNHYLKLAEFVATRTPDIYKPILVGEGASLDVEEVFAEQSEHFELNNIFEGLVSRLGELIAEDVIDNRTVHEALTRLHALFRRTKNGSFATVLMTMNFGRFVMNSFGDVMRANKYAKPFVDNFEKEFSHASEIVKEADDATKQEVVSRLTNAARLQLFIEANPELESKITRFLPPPKQVEDGKTEK